MRRIRIDQVTILHVSDDTELVGTPDGDWGKCLKRDGVFFLPMSLWMHYDPSLRIPGHDGKWSEISDSEREGMKLHEVEISLDMAEMPKRARAANKRKNDA